MFKGLSEQEYNPKGKKSSSLAQSHKSQQYNLGCKEWDYEWKSTNKIYFQGQKPEKSVLKQEVPNSHHFTLGSNDLAYKQTSDHFKSEQMKSLYKDPQQKPEPAKPSKSKTEILKTQYELGIDKPNFVTSNNQFHDRKDDKPVQQIQWKPDRVRFDIIKNQDIDQQKLKANAFPFDFYNEQVQNKGRKTQNYTQLPQENLKIDPITGRKLKF